MTPYERENIFHSFLSVEICWQNLAREIPSVDFSTFYCIPKLATTDSNGKAESLRDLVHLVLSNFLSKFDEHDIQTLKVKNIRNIPNADNEDAS